MFSVNRFQALLLVCLLALPQLDAKSRKGEQYLKQGREAEVRKQWEVALDFYEKAMLDDPADPAYLLSARRVRFQAAIARVDLGQKLRERGQLEEALVEFQKAYSIDPGSAVAEQEIKRTKEMIDREKGVVSTPEQRGMTPAEKVQQATDEKVGRMLPIPELQPITNQISTLKMNNQPVKVLFETVGKLAGINVVFDAEYQAAPGKSTFTVDLSNTTLEEALDYIGIQTKSYWKPLSPNTIFVTNDNITKRRDYEDYVVKVFYIKNATTVQELQEISTTVRSVAEIRRAFTYNALNAILLRGTADQISLAEKLINDLDKPKSEVVIDIVVMEANRGRLRDLGASLTTGGSPGINLPIFQGTTAPVVDGETKDPAGTIPLNKLFSLGFSDFRRSCGALIKLLMSDSQTRVMQQPQVRAISNFKASLKIGEKIPFASGSFQPGVGSVGLNPLVSTQFQFADVGVNIDITPQVHGRDEVSMHVEIEISNVARNVEIGTISQPVISQKKIVHDIRVREGEVNLVGGLLSTQDSKSVSGIPGLMNIPILGRLFSQERVDISRGELLIALIPHVVRSVDYSDANLRGVSAGNDTNVKLNYTARKQVVAPVPAPAVPAIVPAPAATGAGTRLLFNPAVVQAPLSSAVTVQLMVENASDLFDAPLRLKFDPKVLRLTGVQPGALLSSDGAKPNFSENTLNDTGDATIRLNRLPGTAGINGSGALLNFTFQAIERGSSAVSVLDPAFTNSKLQPLAVAAPSVTVTVQ
ncbi:MAG: cohesin domain-containing protein [Bryobacteraceae bacterium]